MVLMFALFVLHSVEALYLFATTAGYGGNLGGVAGADAICAREAQLSSTAPFANSTCKAFLSTPTMDAVSRVNSYYPIYGADGAFIAINISAALAKAVTPKNYAGTSVALFWTGSDQTGRNSQSGNCANWTTSSASVMGVYGSTSTTWMAQAPYQCGYPMHLLCIETVYPLAASGGLWMFQTNSSYTGALGGIYGADNICNAQAALSKPLQGNTFRALLSTSTISAQSRFPNNRPLLSLAGTIFASSLSSAMASNLLSLNSIATGVGNPSFRYWTGTGGTHTCNDWTSTGNLGYIGDTTAQWQSYAVAACYTSYPIVCIQSAPACSTNPCDGNCIERSDIYGRSCTCANGWVGTGELGQCLTMQIVPTSYVWRSGILNVTTQGVNRSIYLNSTTGLVTFSFQVVVDGSKKALKGPSSSLLVSGSFSSPTTKSVIAVSTTPYPIIVPASNNGTYNVTCSFTSAAGAGLQGNFFWCVSFTGQYYCNYFAPGLTLYFPKPTITPGTLRRMAVEPGSVYLVAQVVGETLVFSGSNFASSVMSVWLGRPGNLFQFACTLNSQTTSNTVVCVPDPNGSGGNLVLTVAVDGQNATGSDQYSYPTVPIITAVRGCNSTIGQGTANCPTVGGVDLQVNGTGFIGNVSVLVDMKPCFNVRVDVSLTSLLCSCPPGAGLERSIIVTAASTLSSPQALISFAPPTITKILPSIVGIASVCTIVDDLTLTDCGRDGGGTLTILGSNFGASGATVRIGATLCRQVVHQGVLQVELTCTLPPGNFLNQPVTVSVLNGESIAAGSISYSLCSKGTQQSPGNITECEPCPMGSANPIDGSRCSPCEIGTYADSLGQTRCTNCNPGSYQDKIQQTNCTPCAEGTYAKVSGQISCLPCDIGTYADVPGFQSCLPCPEGSYQPQPGESICIECPNGTYTGSSGQQYCTSCELGKYGNTTALTACLSCETGKSQNTAGQTGCMDCDPGTFAEFEAQFACKACQQGSYGSMAGLSTCTECPTGSFQTMSSQTHCDPCALGSYTASTGAISCLLASPGSYASTLGASSPGPCSVGQYQSASGGTRCNACAVGAYTASPGLAECVLCEAGRFNIATNSSTCTSCDTGRYQLSRGGSVCTTCDAGTFSSSTTSCSECPGNTASPAGGACTSCASGLYTQDHRTCLCPAGTYVAPNSVTTCLPCSAGLQCTGSGLLLSGTATELGYWRSSKAEPVPTRCVVTDNCPGNDVCAAARKGVLCSQCADGYSSSYSGGPCGPCTSKRRATVATAFIFLAVATGLLIIYIAILRQSQSLERELLNRLGPRATVADGTSGLKITPPPNRPARPTDGSSTITNGSIGGDGRPSSASGSAGLFLVRAEPSSLIRDFNPTAIELPERPANLLAQFKIFVGFLQVVLATVRHGDLTWPRAFGQFLSALSFINFDFIPWQSLNCIVSMNALTQAVVVCCLPIFAIVVALPLLIALRMLDKFDFADDSAGRVHRRILWLKFARIVLFSCFLFYPHVSSVVVGVYNCRNVEGVMYLKTDVSVVCGSPEWRKYAYPLIACLVAYPIGIPFMFFMALHRNRKTLDSPATMLSLGSLYEPYAKSLWFFEVLDMIYKLFMTSLVLFAQATRQLPLGIGATGLYLIVILLLDPYKRPNDYFLHCLLLANILVLNVFGHTLQQGDGTISDTIDQILSTFLITLILVMVITFLYIIIRTTKSEIYNCLRRKAKIDRPSSHVSQ